MYEKPKPPFSYVNEDEKFWQHSYLVSFAPYQGWDSAICVNADSEQDAIDYAADYAEERGWVGYFLDPADPDTVELESYGEVMYVGNHGLPVNSGEVNILQLD